MKHLFLTLIAFFSVVLPAFAQNLKTTTWSSYGVSFQAPADLVVEDDSSEGYIAGNDTYYLTIQLLEGEGLKKEELGQELKAIATDDEVTSQSSVQPFEPAPVPWRAGSKETVKKRNASTVTCWQKTEVCGFYISIVYRQENDKTPETILKSFRMEE